MAASFEERIDLERRLGGGPPTVYWLPEGCFVRFLGAWEIIVGLGLLAPVALRLTLLLFWAQMAGTFLVLGVQPDVAFDSGNPLLLTTEGEFVVKNLVLISAGLVIGSRVRQRRGRAAGPVAGGRARARPFPAPPP